MALFDDPVPETPLYTDDVRMINDMFEEQWSLGPGHELNTTFEPSSYMVNARLGQIYVYQTSRNNRISSTDYRTLERRSHISIRVSNPNRDEHYLWCDEVYRILVANRRRGQNRFGGYTYLELHDDHTSNNQIGWYTTTIEIELISFNTPLRSAGFGDRINRQIADRATETTAGEQP